MEKRQILIIVLIITATEELDVKSDYQHYDSSETGIDAMQTNPKYEHFFNGSYGVHDVLQELLSNRSLTMSTKT